MKYKKTKNYKDLLKLQLIKGRWQFYLLFFFLLHLLHIYLKIKNKYFKSM